MRMHWKPPALRFTNGAEPGVRLKAKAKRGEVTEWNDLSIEERPLFASWRSVKLMRFP
jgi:hypothetical protein